MPLHTKFAEARAAEEGRLQALVVDDCLFRAELVRSVLTLLNAVYLTKPIGETNPHASAEPLAWVAEVNRRRATLGGFPVDARTTWARPNDPGNAIQPRPAGRMPAPVQRLAQFFQGVPLSHEFMEDRPDDVPITMKDVIELLARAENPEMVRMRDAYIRWLNSVLDSTNIWTKLRFKDGVIQQVSLIQLNTIERCVAFVIAWLLENRDGLYDRIRRCPFTGREMASPHYWLDFRREADGRMARGTEQIYCCTRHTVAAGAQRRREAAKQRRAVSGAGGRTSEVERAVEANRTVNPGPEMLQAELWLAGRIMKHDMSANGMGSKQKLKVRRQRKHK